MRTVINLLVELFIRLFSDARTSAGGESRLDREAKRLELIIVLAVILLVAAAYFIWLR